MPDRFFCPKPPVAGTLVIEGDEARHLARVRRVARGECVELFDGKGTCYQAEVEEIGRDVVTLRVVGSSQVDVSGQCELTLACAVPKGDRLDWLVEKATELGVTRLIPLICERSVVDPRASKLDRLRRAVVESCKQSRRDILMEIESPTSWKSLLERENLGSCWVAHPLGQASELLSAARRSRTFTLAIGPEGGLTDQEVAEALERGWNRLNLGPLILRVETAALAGSALLLNLARLADPTANQPFEEV